jgi:colanic acid biosynthesis glycosyl transferase WcaI
VRILFVSHFYRPEQGAAVARVSELSRAWARAGARVTVLTGFPHYPTGVISESHRRQLRRLTARETDGEVDVVRSWLIPASTADTRRRMASYVSFFVSVSLRGMFLARPDVVVATSPHLLAALAGFLLARLRRAAFVMDVRDLWPESLTGGGVAREGSTAVGLLERLARFLYDRSDAIVCVTGRQRRYLLERRGVPESRVHVVENGVEEDVFAPMDREAARTALSAEVPGGLGPDRFVIGYVGTLGQAHGMEVLTEVAKILRERLPAALLLIVGEGASRADLERTVEQGGLGNVRFIGQQPRDRVPLWIGASDVGLAMFRPAPVFETIVPVKLIEFMACGRAVIAAVPGYAAELVEESGAGLAAESGNASAIAEAVVAIAGSRERPGMERSGRTLVLERFRRSAQATRYLELLSDVVAQAKRSKHTDTSRRNSA